MLFLGDDATILRCPLLNILAYGENISVSVLVIVYFQGHLAYGNKNTENSFVINFWNIWNKSTQPKHLSDVVMFDGALNVQIEGILLKVHYPKLTFMCVVEHKVSLFFNDVSNILIVNQMIYAHNMIYNIFDSGIYHKPHSIFKSKYQ